ncbi:YbbR-like domain-containing protein [Seonamhaeicola sp. ML3]|uniref:YbbR-like domain-containing protein n=1 Tax=Seonamhaeicola sp. ML3 TaxID=2937786 RepID=UPI00200C3625|nr:YbbR-like domain-containing protein [Seonamhaeicola sp. ML3]
MIKKLKSKISASIKNKTVNVFLLFLLFSFIILIFSKLSKNYTNTITFEIEKVNIPEEEVILNDSFYLDIDLKTHGFRWFQYYIDKPKIKIDFSKDVTKTGGVYLWNKSIAYLNNTQFDKQVQLLNLTPDTLSFRYDVNQVKKVPIRLNANIKYSAGYNSSTPVVIEPDSIVIIGPHVMVKEINAIDTEEVLIEELRNDLNQNIKLSLPKNKGDLKFSDTEVNLKATVEKFTEGTLKIPVRVINVPEDINIKYFPREVSVSYYVSLKNFKSVKENDFKLICDYSKVIENQAFLIPELVKFPKTVKNERINQQRIEFIINR